MNRFCHTFIRLIAFLYLLSLQSITFAEDTLAPPAATSTEESSQTEESTEPQVIPTDQSQIPTNQEGDSSETKGNLDLMPMTTELMERSVDELIYTRDSLSKEIVRLAEKVDRYIGQEEAEEMVNESFMRMRFASTFGKSGDIDGNAQVKIKLDLPISKKRYRIIIENDPDEDASSIGNNAITEEEGKLDDEENKHFLSGIRYVISDEIDSWYVATDWGVRVRLHPKVFTRVKAKRDYEIGENWRLRVKESIYYFNDSGLGEKTQFFLDRPISESLRFRSTSEAKWGKDDKKFEFAQIYSLLKSLDEKTAVDYRLGFLGESQPTGQLTDYYINANYRMLIYRDWLFFEVKPQLLWAREDGWDLDPSITFRLEVFFLTHKDK